MRGQVCTACQRPDAAEIDQALVAREPQRSVAKRFGLGRGVVGRHARSHLRARVRLAAKAHQSSDGQGLLDRLAEENEKAEKALTALKKLLDGTFARAYNAGEVASCVSALSEMRKLSMDWLKERREQLRFEAQLLGQLRDGGAGTTVVVLDPVTAENMARIFLQRRGVLPAAPTPDAIETTAAEQEKESIS